MENIVIAPYGNKSNMLNTYWLNQKEQKQFDVCLLFYHEKIDNPDLYADADYFYHLKDFKYHMLYKLFTDVKPGWLKQYKYFYFLDDDIKIDTAQINPMFALSSAFDSWISQASLSKNSFCSWPMFKQQAGSFCRFVGQIEVMAPLFNAMALEKCLPSFIGNRSSWGVDSVWSKILDYPEKKLIVFDAVTMQHTKPVGEGELYKKLGVDPKEEWKNITEKFGARKQNYREYGRLAIVDKQHHFFNFLSIRSQEYFRTIRRHINDYDFPSRVKSRLSKLNINKTEKK